MINQVEKKNPKRRFKEFLGKENWNVHTLGTVLMSMYNGQTPSRSKGEYWNGKINWLTSGELNCGIVNDTFEKITELGLDSANLKIIPKGILVIAITGLEASGTRGNCAILGCNTTLNQSCMALFPIRSLISSDFLFNWYLFIGDYYGIKYTQGTKQQSYNSKILNDLEIVIPSLDEQNKISGFFSKLDSMIDFQKRKLNKLQATKKALLQEMFPEKGQDKPKRRFKGFIDAWEQRKLDSLGKIITGNTPSTSKKEYWSPNSDGVVWITPTDINSVKTQCSERLLTKDGASQARIVPANSILVTCIASIGKNTINTVEAAFNQQINALVPHFSNSYFILTMLNNMESAFKRVAGTSATSIINKKEFGQLSALLPEIEEQNKIGRIFELIDNNITLHQRKLDKLKNLKQAYLNEMFV